MALLVLGAAAGCGGDGDGNQNGTVGEITVDLDVRKGIVRSRETLVANLVGEAIHRGVPEAEVVLVNGGNLRFDPNGRPTGLYPAGQWTDAMIHELLPFDFEANGSQVLVTVSGAQLKSVFERSVASLQQPMPDEMSFEQLKGWFLCPWGARYRADLSKPAQVVKDDFSEVLVEGERIVELTINGQPLDLQRMYRVSGNQFMVDGMDGHVALKRGLNRTILGKTSADYLKAYLSSASPVTPALDGRIVIERTP